MSMDFDVVIVGGGAAGVGAARRLTGSGLSVMLLEASSRLGGRAWTHEIAGLNLDLGCGWLHSAEKNSWAAIARAQGVRTDESRAAWGVQYGDLGFTRLDQAEARKTFEGWLSRLQAVRGGSDRAADALDARAHWNDYIQAIVNFISGGSLEHMSAADYLTYDDASTESNWRLPGGYGALIAGSLPRDCALQLARPVDAVELTGRGVDVRTASGTLRARAVILTVSTAVLTGDNLKLPAALQPWREAAARLPLGRNEKLFLEILDSAHFETETQVLGNPRSACTGSYYIRPMDLPVVECFLGGASARILEEGGITAAFEFALVQLGDLFGSDVRRRLRPLAASGWGRALHIGGGYSYALPGHAAARQVLARPFEQRIFFAGEATSRDEFSTAHGALDSGIRAAQEVIAACR